MCCGGGLVTHHGGGLSLWRRILIKMRVVSLTSYSLDFVQFIGLFIMPVWLYLVRIKNNSDFQCSDWITWVMWHGSRGITWYEFYVISVGHHFGGTFHAKPRRLYWIKLNRFKPNEPKPKTITTYLPKIFDPIHAARKCSNSSRKKSSSIKTPNYDPDYDNLVRWKIWAEKITSKNFHIFKNKMLILLWKMEKML